MKVMLISLPSIDIGEEDLFGLGIGYLAGALKQNHEVVAYHFTSMYQARKQIPLESRLYNPDMVGLTCNTFNRASVREIVVLLKKFNKSIKIVLGGVHASFLYEQMLKAYNADIVVIGEGENTLLELCAAIEQNKPLGSVKGIAYKENGEVIRTPPRDVISDLDKLPMPDYSYASRLLKDYKMGFLVTSRGCPVRCTFCSTSSYWGQGVRMYPVTRVVDEMEMVISEFGVQKIFFYDDTFNLGIERVKAICKEIMDRGIKVEWACQCRVTPVSQDMIACMVEAGCRHISWGVESGSQEILRIINKQISLPQIINALELSKKFNDVMSTGIFLMVGNPGETVETINETVNLLNNLPLSDHPDAAILYILPGTLLYENLKKGGFIKDDDWLKYDSVPFYTVENSFQTLRKWRNKIRQSGTSAVFLGPDKKFFNVLSPKSDFITTITKAKNFCLKLTQPKRVLSRIKTYLPSGRIRF